MTEIYQRKKNPALYRWYIWPNKNVNHLHLKQILPHITYTNHFRKTQLCDSPETVLYKLTAR